MTSRTLLRQYESDQLPFLAEQLERRLLFAAVGVKPGVATVLSASDAVAARTEAPLPRGFSDAELEYIRNNPDWASTASVEASTPPPTGPVEPVAEYEPMEGLVISWLTYTSTLGQITKRVTDAGGRVYVGVTSSSVQSSTTTSLNSLGVNMSNVTFYTVPLNSVWARDYGPRYVYEGDVRVITDHQYNRPRPLDDMEPVVFSQFKEQEIYQIGLNGTSLIHGGGNFHLNANGDAYATSLVTDENPSFTAAQIQQIWNTYEGDDVTITGRFPTSVDSTGHIDMWMQIYADKKVFISDWPSNPGSAQDVICDNTAALMESRGYQVTRLPAYSIGGTHYTYANMVIFNNIVLLPKYNNGPGSAVSNQALATVQQAFGRTIRSTRSTPIRSSPPPACSTASCSTFRSSSASPEPTADSRLSRICAARTTATRFCPGSSSISNGSATTTRPSPRPTACRAWTSCSRPTAARRSIRRSPPASRRWDRSSGRCRPASTRPPRDPRRGARWRGQYRL